MNLILITSAEPYNPELTNLLLGAADSLHITVDRLNVEQLSLEDVRAKSTGPTDLLYLQVTSKKARIIESILLNRPKEQRPANIYTRPQVLGPNCVNWCSTFTMASYKMPIIPSIFLDESWANASTTTIQRHVATIGGFPVILKQTGMSHGLGVRLIQTAKELQIILSRFTPDEYYQYALRQYLEEYRHARLIIVGGKVVDSIEYIKPEDDFRTNASAEIKVIPQKFSDEIKRIAEEAALFSSTTFGGADVLIDANTSKPYLAEFNSPCNFARAQNLTGVDTATKILEYLASTVST